VRAIRTPEYLYVRNYEPDRWPAGNPENRLSQRRRRPQQAVSALRIRPVLPHVIRRRPGEELLPGQDGSGLREQPGLDSEHAQVKRELRDRMEAMLREEGDPRALGNAAFFDTIDYTGPTQTLLRHLAQKPEPLRSGDGVTQFRFPELGLSTPSPDL